MSRLKICREVMRDFAPRHMLLLASALMLLGGCGGSGFSGGSGQVGVAKEPATAIELVGHFDQVGGSIHGYGFVSHVSGLDDSSLFVGGGSWFTAASGATEKPALLTFRFDTSLTNRAIHGPIIDVGQQGTFEFYLHQHPSSDFDNPASFASGRKVASGSLSAQEVLDVIAPNRGIATASGSLTETSVTSFVLGGARRELGHPGLGMRISISGKGQRTAVSPPAAKFDFAGDLTVAG
jgi:hypothetical protein